MIGPALRHTGRVLGLLACWAVWLFLGGLLAVQIYIAAHHEMAVPRPLLTAMQSRLSFAGLKADFGRTRFDPTGRILMEDVRLRFAGFEDPVLVARVVSTRLRPLALLAGRVEAREIRISGLSLRVPAMFSPSGTSDEIVSDADADLVPRDGWVRLPFFSARAGGVAIAGSGAILLPAVPAARAPAAAVAPALARRYAELAQAAASWLAAIGAVESPVVRLRVESNADHSLGVEAVVDADAVRIPGGARIQADRVRATARWRFRSDPAAPVRIDFEADRLNLPGVARVRGVLGSVAVQPLADGAWPARVRSVSLAARSMAGDGIPVLAPYGEFDVSHYPAVTGSVAGLVWDQPFAASGSADIVARSADLRFAARIDRQAREFLETHRMKGISNYLDWSEPIAAEGECRFGAGGHFADAWARVAIHGLVARTVRIDEAGGRVSFDGRNLLAERAFARIGSDVAAGTFGQDRQGNYRFLLRGRLRPLDIAPWIAGSWWPAFFGNFGFPTVPPTADIDLRGNWTDGGTHSRIFLNVDAPDTRIEGLGFDEVTGRLFVRPQFVDALEFRARRGAGEAAGSFSRSFNLDVGDWEQLNLKVTSTLDPGPALALLGPEASAAISGIEFQAPPRVEVTGVFTGPGSVAGSHRRLAVIARSDRQLTFHHLPFEGASFVARLDDDDLTIDNAEADVAGGHAVGAGELSGPPNVRKLRFNVSVDNLSLPQAISTAAGLAGRTDPASGKSTVGKFIQPKAAVRVNAAASAQGLWGYPYSFHGSGTIDLRGGEIGQLHMLGLLSDLLRFTSLRFTSASAQYIIDGRTIDFPDIAVTGANSAIVAQGTCDLESGNLDIRAKLKPFKESHALPQRFMDLVLTPLANALEVRLVGTLAKPDWVFVNGPSNVLRAPGPANGVAPEQ